LPRRPHLPEDGRFGETSLPRPAGLDKTVVLPSEAHAGGAIGRYKLLEKIGEGGFGVVYVAEQKEPVRRRVALKIIKLGVDARQALAMMDHPNIVKALDAEATEIGCALAAICIHGQELQPPTRGSRNHQPARMTTNHE
jgi:serine/threonine protein kinase